MTVDEVTNNTREEGRRGSRRRNRQVASPAQEMAKPARKDKPTPARRETAGKGNIVTRFFRAVARYFTETVAELKKVTWPTREESIRLSGIVIAVTVVSSLALGIIDYLYGELFRLGFGTPVIFIIFGIALLAAVGGGVYYLRRRSSG